EDVLQAQRDQGRVLRIVVKRVAVGDQLDDQARGLVQDRGVLRLAAAEGPGVDLGEIAPQRIGQKGGRIQHGRLQSAFRPLSHSLNASASQSDQGGDGRAKSSTARV